jgi:recombination protein RecA
VNRGEAIKNGTEQVGSRTKVNIHKNKIAPPFREAEFDLIFGKGISQFGEVLDLAVQKQIVVKAGAWFTVGEERLQGREGTLQYLKENPKVYLDLARQVRAAFGLSLPEHAETFLETHHGLPVEQIQKLNDQIKMNGQSESVGYPYI